MRDRFLTLIANRRSLTGEIGAWQSLADRINVGGRAQADWLASTTTTGIDATGRTYIAPGLAIRQDGYIRGVTVNVGGFGAGQVWKFKVYRYNSGTSNFDFVAEQAFTPAATGAVTVALAAPIAVQMGDVVGMFLPTVNARLRFSTPNSTIKTKVTSGDIGAGGDAFVTDSLSSQMDVDVLSNLPYLCVTGDSIPEGHNGAANWHGAMHNVALTATLPGGEPTSEIANQLRGLIGDGTVLQYQNFSLGSQIMSWVNTTGMPECVERKPKAIIVHCGINDVSLGTAWADVETALNGIKAQLLAGQILMIDEVLPWTAGSDAQAAAIRTLNAALAVWCAANGARLILCHDAMGQVRVSTGEIDDLLTAYNQGDGVHLSADGVAALAGIHKDVQ
jgi:lysophospholipase L1-like esterase